MIQNDAPHQLKGLLPTVATDMTIVAPSGVAMACVHLPLFALVSTLTQY